MRTASPWWASLCYAVGLVLLFAGERAFHHVDDARLILSGAGAVLVIGVTALRAWLMLTTRGARRRVELVLLLCQLVSGLGLLVYALTTKTGMGWLGYTDLTAKGAVKTSTMLTVAWLFLMLVSLIPLFVIEVSLGAASRTGIDRGSRKTALFDEDAVEFFRVRESALSGLTIGLAASLMLVTCNVATERNIQRDVSYFKISQPGESTVNVVKNTAKPIRALIFFPEVNEVKTQVKQYFDALSSATDGKLTVEIHDRQAERTLASHYKVTKDGTVVLTTATPDEDKLEKTDKPPKAESLDFDTDLEKARRGKSKLRTLDREVNSHLIKLMRDKLKVYLTVGHGEMNDPDSVPPQQRGATPFRGTTMMKRVLGQDQYELRDLGAFQLISGVPDDAAAVMVLAPSIPLRPEELEALDKYVAKGGHILIALDPRAADELGPLSGRLGVEMAKGTLADDKVFLDQHHGPSDHRFTATTQFSAHASTTSLSRAQANVGVLLIESGALIDHPFAGEEATRQYVIHSMPSSWLDLDDNMSFDSATEKKDRYNIAAAIEGPKAPGADGKLQDGWKALVYADADLFADYPPGRPALDLTSGPLIEDAVKWLAGESAITGDIVSEEDVAIEHTRSTDQIWFYLMMVGAPLLVLVAGLVFTSRRKRAKVAS
ncbi:MAG TPA: Gldg family protein [Kofleriaceae bacterium]|nr:Gldg family protein [Kofleriaceae bacterium]